MLTSSVSRQGGANATSRDHVLDVNLSAIRVPVLVATGTADDIAGPARPLLDIIPGAQLLDIPGRDHMRAVGDRVFKEGTLAFLDGRP